MSESVISGTPIEPFSMSFAVTAGTVLTIQSDGKVLRGAGFDNDHAASVAFLEVLSTYVPCFISELRQRAERAEAELARLKAISG